MTTKLICLYCEQGLDQLGNRAYKKRYQQVEKVIDMIIDPSVAPTVNLSGRTKAYELTAVGRWKMTPRESNPNQPRGQNAAGLNSSTGAQNCPEETRQYYLVIEMIIDPSLAPTVSLSGRTKDYELTAEALLVTKINRNP